MATQTAVAVVEEGPRNAVVQLTGVVTDGDVNLPSVIPLSMFTNNDVRSTLVGLRVDEIEFSFSDQLKGVVSWHGGTPQLIAGLAATGKLSFRKDGGRQPNRGNSGYDGSIDFKTAGFPAGTTQTYSVLLRMVKLYT